MESNLQIDPSLVPVGELGDAFEPDNHCLVPVEDLTGKSLHLVESW